MKARPEAGVHHKLDLEQVVAITADINYSYVYFSNGSCVHRSRTLKWYLERWPTLLRIHKNALINVEHIATYHLVSGRQPSGYVIMKNNLRLDVSHRNIKKVADFLAKRQEAPDL